MYDIQKMNIWKSSPKTETRNEIDDIDITELCLSVRSFNCLKRSSCNTVGDVLAIIESERGLKSIRNLGKTSEEEILSKIEELKQNYRMADTASTKKKTVIKPAKKIWDTRIDAFGLTEYSKTRLKNSGIQYVKDLYRDDLSKEPGWYAVRELFEKIPV